MRKVALTLGLILGLYLLGRAVAEPFLIDLANPATYRDSWGGPSLLGVLAVHCGPGLLAGAAIVTWSVRNTRRQPELGSDGRDPDPR